MSTPAKFYDILGEETIIFILLCDKLEAFVLMFNDSRMLTIRNYNNIFGVEVWTFYRRTQSAIKTVHFSCNRYMQLRIDAKFFNEGFSYTHVLIQLWYRSKKQHIYDVALGVLHRFSEQA